LGHDLARRGNAGEKLFAGASAFALLIEYRLAKLDAFAADVNVARSFDQRPDVSVTLSAERTEGVLLGRSTAARTADVLRWHKNRSFPVGDARIARKRSQSPANS
jgi:hypothetical protein